MNFKSIEKVNPDIANAMARELNRQKNNLELIASENIVSPAVMAAQGSILTNKYAEGYPDKRYYGGCEFVDIAEKIAIKTVKKLFNASYANVQPHSGSQANMAVYFSLLNPGDTVLGMDLSHGGHLTHGSSVSFSGKLFKFLHYGVKKETGIIDYEQVAKLADKHKPKLIVAGASAYPRFIDFEKFSKIAKEINAYFMVDMAHIAGLVAGGVHPSPIPYANITTSTTHKTLRGPRGGLILAGENHSPNMEPNIKIGKLIDKQIFPGIQGGPLMHVIAAKAVAFSEADTNDFKQYQKQIVLNAKALSVSLMEAGIELVSGGTDNHMMLADLTNLDITGKKAEDVLEQAGITVNKNTIPFESKSPFVTSGIRIGTPVLTTRGMNEERMQEISEYIVEILKNPDSKKTILNIRNKVTALCEKYPLFQEPARS